MQDNEPKHTSRKNFVCLHGLTYTPTKSADCKYLIAHWATFLLNNLWEYLA